MKTINSLIRFITLFVFVTITSVSTVTAQGNRMTVQLVGTGTAYASSTFTGYGLPPVASDCFDMDVVDLRTGRLIGEATDCVSNVAPVGDGLAWTSTTLFVLNGGTLITEGRVTVQPVTTGSPEFTHITGALPLASENNILYSDGKFKNAAGSVRLSGALDLSDLINGNITFDAIYVLDI